jgi:hypothetical protein
MIDPINGIPYITIRVRYPGFENKYIVVVPNPILSYDEICQMNAEKYISEENSLQNDIITAAKLSHNLEYWFFYFHGLSVSRNSLSLTPSLDDITLEVKSEVIAFEGKLSTYIGTSLVSQTNKQVICGNQLNFFQRLVKLETISSYSIF